MGKSFQRKLEDFECLQCGAQVKGDGFTNHCPQCLWSRHVDQQPGDRLAECRGMMAPISVEKSGDSYRILHQCEQCGHQKWNKNAPQDDFERLLQLAKDNTFR